MEWAYRVLQNVIQSDLNPFKHAIAMFHEEDSPALMLRVFLIFLVLEWIFAPLGLIFLIGYQVRVAGARMAGAKLPAIGLGTVENLSDILADIGRGTAAAFYVMFYVIFPVLLIVYAIVSQVPAYQQVLQAGVDSLLIVDGEAFSVDDVIALLGSLLVAIVPIMPLSLPAFLIGFAVFLPLFFATMAHMARTGTPGIALHLPRFFKLQNMRGYFQLVILEFIAFGVVFALSRVLSQLFGEGTLPTKIADFLAVLAFAELLIDWAKWTQIDQLQYSSANNAALNAKKKQTFMILGGIYLLGIVYTVIVNASAILPSLFFFWLVCPAALILAGRALWQIWSTEFRRSRPTESAGGGAAAELASDERTALLWSVGVVPVVIILLIVIQIVTSPATLATACLVFGPLLLFGLLIWLSRSTKTR
ncbi:MAG TPA: hypothetical protein VKY59_02555, partial [Spirillospora sp.]|nr:hypothetical protein [Spirillospora sp.]